MNSVFYNDVKKWLINYFFFFFQIEYMNKEGGW